MKTSISTKHIGLTAACALALSLVSGAALAQGNTNPELTQIWHNPEQTIWRSAYGLCWHSTYGPPPSGECNPAPVAQYVAPAPAPAPYVAPAPAQAQYVAPAPVIPQELPRKKDRN